MTNDNILPVNTGSNWGGDALAAGAGGFFGSWFGNGWGGNWGNNRGGNDTNLVIDGINGVANTINNMNTSMLQGQCQLQAGGDRNSALLQNTLSQGFAGINSTITNNGYETRLAINSQSAQQAQCCCDLRQLIAQEGCATRQLIKDVQTDQVRDQLCQERARNAQLETQASINAQTAAIFERYKM